jgi:predicted PurR-regulated permease PerM
VVLRFIPSLGGALTAVVPIALAIAVAPGWDLLVWTVLMFGGIELIFANVVEPWIYGRSTGLSASPSSRRRCSGPGCGVSSASCWRPR